MWGRLNLETKCSAGFQNVQLQFGTEVKSRLWNVWGWGNLVGAGVALAWSETFSFGVYLSAACSFPSNFLNGGDANWTPAHGMRNVSDLHDVSRAPARPGNDSLLFGRKSDVIAGRAWGWLRLYWAWHFITKSTRRVTTCTSPCENTDLGSWELDIMAFVKRYKALSEGKGEWSKTIKQRNADRYPVGKRDSMSVNADGDSNAWSNRAAESWIQQMETPCPCFVVICGSNMQLAPLPRTAAVEE